MADFDEELDATGLNCPLPILRAKKALNGMDSLLSTAQMPAGLPVGTMAIGKAGATNAALLAAAIVANDDESVANALDQFRQNQTDKVLADPDPRS